MSSDAAAEFTSALLALQRAFDELARPAVIIGGIAAIARGVPRQTIDIDAAIEAQGLDVNDAIEVLGRHGFEPRIERADEFARQRLVLLLRHRPSGLRLGLSLAWLPFERDALARASTFDFGGVSLRVVAVEDLIVLKAVAWPLRDRDDIERLLIRHGRSVNLQQMRAALVQSFGMLEEPERLADFDRLAPAVEAREQDTF
jgi:hypothetical protein